MNKINHTVSRIRAIDRQLLAATQARLDNLTKPQGSLGDLEELATRLVAMTGKETPRFDHKAVIVMAADHGVVAEGVSAYPKDVTAQMVLNFLRGGAAINVLSRHIGARVIVVDMGISTTFEALPGLVVKKIGFGTENMAIKPAMSREQAIRSIETGIDVLDSEALLDIVCAGDMGIGNTTASSAIIAAMTGAAVEKVTGRGAGVGAAGLSKKIETIKRALSLHRPDPEDALDILSKVGGFEIGGLAGVILAGAARRIPVVTDGLISTAAALLAYRLQPTVRDYLIAGHSSAEIGHQVALDYIGLKPLLKLGMRLGEGTGAALSISLIEASIKLLVEMATFKQAGVSQRS